MQQSQLSVSLEWKEQKSKYAHDLSTGWSYSILKIIFCIKAIVLKYTNIKEEEKDRNTDMEQEKNIQ